MSNGQQQTLEEALGLPPAATPMPTVPTTPAMQEYEQRVFAAQPTLEPSIESQLGLPPPPASGVKPPEAAPYSRPTIVGEFFTGVGSGLDQVGSDFQSAGALALALFGDDKGAMELMQAAQRTEEYALTQYPKTINRIEDVDSITDFLRWASRSLGEQVPVLASTIIGGGAGGVVGRLVGRGLISTGMISSLGARFPSLATAGGAALTGGTIETGATGSEIFGATGQIRPDVAIPAGIIKGTLESVVPMAMAARLGLTPAMSASLTNRINQTFDRLLPGRIGTAVGIGATEMVTEVLQEATDIAARAFVDANYDILGPEAASRILNAAAGGGLVGTTLGLAARRNRNLSPQNERDGTIPPSIAREDVATTDAPGIPAATATEATNPLEGTERVATEQNVPGVVEATIPAQDAQLTTAAERPPVASWTPPVQPDVPLAQVGGVEIPSAPAQAAAERMGLPVRDMRYNLPAYGDIEAAHPFFAQEGVVSYASNNPTARAYNNAAHKPGTVEMLHQQSGEPISPLMQSIHKTAQKMMKRFGLGDEKLILFFNDLNSGGPVKLGEHYELGVQKLGKFSFLVDGQISPGGRGTTVIGINSHNGKAKAVLALAHEFGHLLAHKYFRGADPKLQQAMVKQYEDHLIRIAMGDRTASGYFLTADRLKDGGIDPNTDFAKYALRFDEWLAEQVSKYFAREYQEAYRDGRLNELEKFFVRVGRKIKELWESLGQNFHPEPAATVESWLESLQRRDPSKVDLATVVMSERDLKYTEKQPGEPTQPPPQSISRGVGNLLRAVGVPQAQITGITKLQDRFGWFADRFFNLAQIAKLNPHIKPLLQFFEHVQAWYARQMEWIGLADGRAREWRSLGREQSGALTQFILAVDRMEYLTPAERTAGIERHPTNPELAALGTKYKLTPPAFDVFLKVQDDFKSVLAEVERISLQALQRTVTDPAVLAQETARINQEFTDLRAKPYFPHTHFGTHLLEIYDKQHGKLVYSRQFDSAIMANKAVSSILTTVRATHPQAVSSLGKIPEQAMAFRGLPPNLLRMMRNMPGIDAVQSAWLDKLIVEMAPSASFRKQLAGRTNIPGFSEDMPRAYASFFFHASKHLARIEYRPLLDANVAQMDTDIASMLSTNTTFDVRKRNMIRNYMTSHMEHIFNPKSDYPVIRSMAFMWYLGFNVSSAFLNLTQIPLVAWPYLSAHFGNGRAMNELMKAAKDLQKYYKAGPAVISTPFGKALDRGMKDGALDESQSSELSGLAAGGTYLGRLIQGTKVQRTAAGLAHMGQIMFQVAEKVNRRIVFRAAWNLAMKDPSAKHLFALEQQNQVAMTDLMQQGFSQIEARAYIAAKDAVNSTQFQYASHMRPKFMQGAKGVFFTFFMFQQSMLFFARYSPGNIKYLAMMLMMAGLMGMPGAEDLEAVARFTARKLIGVDFDVKREVRELVTGMLGDAVPPDIFLHGLGRVGLGMPALMDLIGIPMPQFDFSRRIGMGRIIPGLAELGPPGGNFDQIYSKITSDAAGASFGIGLNLLKALADDSLPWDDFKRWERAVPTALANLGKAVRLGSEERERTRTGATVVSFDMTDPQQIIETGLRALGFQPTRLAREWDRIAMQKEVEAYWTGRRIYALRMYNHGLDVGSSDMVDRAREDISKYNEEVPYGGMRISGDQLRKSRKEHARQTRLREAGLPNNKSMRPLARDVQALFPETKMTPVTRIEDAEDMTGVR